MGQLTFDPPGRSEIVFKLFFQRVQLQRKIIKEYFGALICPVKLSFEEKNVPTQWARAGSPKFGLQPTSGTKKCGMLQLGINQCTSKDPAHS